MRCLSKLDLQHAQILMAADSRIPAGSGSHHAMGLQFIRRRPLFRPENTGPPGHFPRTGRFRHIAMRAARDASRDQCFGPKKAMNATVTVDCALTMFVSPFGKKS